MAVHASFTPPPPQQGELSLYIDELTAQRLLALMGECTGTYFSELFAALDDVLPETGRLRLTLGTQPGGSKFVVSLGQSCGARFDPR